MRMRAQSPIVFSTYIAHSGIACCAEASGDSCSVFGRSSATSSPCAVETLAEFMREERALISVHEAGHAVVALLLGYRVVYVSLAGGGGHKPHRNPAVQQSP